MDGFKGTVKYDASLDNAQYIIPQVPSTVYFCFVPECSNDAQCIETLYLRRHHVTCEASMRLLLKEWIPQLRSRASDPWFTTVSPALHHQPPPSSSLNSARRTRLCSSITSKLSLRIGVFCIKMLPTGRGAIAHIEYTGDEAAPEIRKLLAAAVSLIQHPNVSEY